MQNSDAQLKSALQTAQSDLDWVVSEVKAGKLSQEEAEECIRSIYDGIPTVKAASAAVMRAESAGEEGWGQESAASGAWYPQVDDSVRLLKLGGKIGRVSCHYLFVQYSCFAYTLFVQSQFHEVDQFLCPCNSCINAM